MGYGNYQNGGVWDWWGGVQIKAEFLNGFSETGRTHLLQVANDWREHPGNIIEWHSSTDPRHEGSHYYSAAAGTMGSAIIEGFFGVSLTGQGLQLQPRLGLNDGYIRVYQAATDRYAAYSYDWDQDVSKLDYGTNAGGAVIVKVLRLRSEQVTEVKIDGAAVEFETETVGYDTYTVFVAPTGQHKIEIVKGPPLARVVAATSEAVAEPPAEAESIVPTRSAAPNLIAPVPGSVEPEPSLEAEPSPADDTADLPTSDSRAHRASETRLAVLQFISVALVILTCLALLVLVALRRLAGLA